MAQIYKKRKSSISKFEVTLLSTSVPAFIYSVLEEASGFEPETASILSRRSHQ